MLVKPIIHLCSFVLLASLVAACGPTATPVPTEPPPTTQPAAAPISASDVVGITWQWAKLTETEPAGQSVVADPENYTLALMPDGTANVKADCNRVSWPYNLEGNVLSFDTLFATTLAACPPGSLYDQYLKLLGNGGTVALENGQLVLELNDDVGLMIFDNGGPAEAATEGSPPDAVTGTVVAEGNPSLTQGAMLEVRVEDVSLADAPATQVGGQIQEISGFPTAFEAPYDPQLIDPKHTYGLTVRITDASGSLLFINTQATNVLTQGNPARNVEVLVEPVGAPAALGDDLLGKWQWLRSIYNNDTELIVDDPSRYIVEFKADGTLGIQADCNQLTWTYTREANSLTINDFGPTTLAQCPPDSLDQEFLKDLSEVADYVMHEGNLVLNNRADAGNMIFQPAATSAGGSVGIDPQSVSINTMGLPYSWQANLVPATPYDASQPPGPRGLPEHIQINFGGDPTARQHPDERQPGDPVLYIIPVEAYKNMYQENSDQSVASTVDMQLEMLLDPPEGLPKNGMPVLPFEEISGYNDLAVQGSYLDSGMVRGLRFVGRFAQDANPVTNEGLRYIFQGHAGEVSEYLIAFFYPVTSEALPSSMEEVPASEQASATEDPEPYLDEKGEMLNSLAESDWEPDLALLDSVIGSLKFETSATDRDLLGRWYWLRSTYNNDTELVVDVPSRYTVEFKTDGTLAIRADCNLLTWTYTREGNSLTINAFGPTTLAQCPPGSLDQEFLNDLSEVAGYVMHEGNLVLNLRADVGNMIFGK
jgi:putative lipoprotein